MFYVCVRVGERIRHWVHVCVGCGSTDTFNLPVCIGEILLGYFCDHLLKSCESAFPLIFNGKFYEMKNYSILRVDVCVHVCECVSV